MDGSAASRDGFELRDSSLEDNNGIGREMGNADV